jgi:hypothetical protein
MNVRERYERACLERYKAAARALREALDGADWRPGDVPILELRARMRLTGVEWARAEAGARAPKAKGVE